MTSNAQLLVKERGELSLTTSGLGTLVRSLLSDGIPCRFKVKGASMSPLIRNGDTVTILPASCSVPRLGMVPVCHSPETGSLVIHRLIGWRDGTALTKGDNSSSVDLPVPAENIIGCVSYIERNGRRQHLGLGPERLPLAVLSRVMRVSLIFSAWRRIPGILSHEA